MLCEGALRSAPFVFWAETLSLHRSFAHWRRWICGLSRCCSGDCLTRLKPGSGITPTVLWRASREGKEGKGKKQGDGEKIREEKHESNEEAGGYGAGEGKHQQPGEVGGKRYCAGDN